MQRPGVDGRSLRQRGEDRSNLRSEMNGAIGDPVVDELDAHGIARQDQPTEPGIPYRDTEHPVEAIENARAPLLVAVDDHFRVGARSEDVPASLQLQSQFPKVVDLAVENDPNGRLPVRHRLVAAVQIDDGKAPKTQADAAGAIRAVVVGTTMCNRCGHRGDCSRLNGALVAEIVLTANSTHSAACKTTNRTVSRSPRSKVVSRALGSKCSVLFLADFQTIAENRGF